MEFIFKLTKKNLGGKKIKGRSLFFRFFLEKNFFCVCENPNIKKKLFLVDICVTFFLPNENRKRE